MILLVLLGACTRDPAVFELLPSDQTGITFSNDIVDDDFLINALSFDNVYNGGGVGIGDVNNDGLQDIFFSGNMVPNRLYLNRGNFRFEDISEVSGIDINVWSTGVAMADVNQDGLLDIYVCVGGTSEDDDMANLLFINEGPGKNNLPSFRESAQAFGVADTAFSVQAAFFDYDLDGDLDLYVLNNALENADKNAIRPKKTNGEAINTDHLYRNEGNGSFTNVSREAGILIEGYGLGLAIRDFNQDGWLDIYCSNDFLTNDLLYVNNQDGTFTDRAGEYLKHQVQSGMGNDAADFNNDGLMDIIALDMLPRDRKREKLMLPPMSYDMYRLILSYGYEPQYMRNMLHLNNGFNPDGKMTFSEIGQLAGIHATDWSWSALFADYDNDGLKDLFISNGHRKDLTNLDFIIYGQRSIVMGTEEAIRKQMLEKISQLPPIAISNFIFQNSGDLTFSDVTESWGLSRPGVSQGAAFADLDNDGDLDLVVNNIDEEAFIYRNTTSQTGHHHYLRLKLNGPENNRDGYGTKITLRHRGKYQFHEHSPFRGYQSTVEPDIHFGLGQQSVVDTLEVFWPDGKYQILRAVPADQVLTLDYRTSEPRRADPPVPSRLLFKEVSLQTGLSLKHTEAIVNDFRDSPLLPHKLSQNGPGLAVGDFDGNGLDDVFVGADRGFARSLFLQVSPGKFSLEPVLMDTVYEDMGSLLFDADQDGDLDLYMVSGGYVPLPQSEPSANQGSVFNIFQERRNEVILSDSVLYQDRLYLNDSKGHFTRNEEALPEIRASGSCVTAADFDADGDLDLFVGGRFLPGRYPLSPRSFLFRNDSEPDGPVRFTDVTAQFAPDLMYPGMVTSALWTDFDQDGQIDLILAGEWMSIRFFRNTGMNLVDVTDRTGLPPTSGWWNSLVAGDFDDDGDMDYVAGNMGLNTKFHISVTEPLRIYAGDFDHNGTLDAVLTHYVQEKNYVSHGRDLIIRQIPGMKLRFKTYQEYATATFEETFTDRELRNARVFESARFENSYLENLGNGKFRIKSLPLRAQFAPIYGLSVNDYNQDGFLDILFVGNSYATEPLTGRYSASVGGLLAGDGTGAFTFIDSRESGFFVDGDAKGLAELHSGSDQLLVLATQNDDSLKVFSVPIRGQRISLKAGDRYGQLSLKNGKTRRIEFHVGSGYLSQSSRTYMAPPYALGLNVFGLDGVYRELPVTSVLARKE